MRAHATLARLAAMAGTLLHLVVAGVAPLTDAWLEVAALDHEVHIEAERKAPCAPGHDEWTCQLCRIVDGAVDGPFSSSAALPLEAICPRSPPIALRTLPTIPAASPLGPRAPPNA